MVPNRYSGGRGKQFHEKKTEVEISCQTPFKAKSYSIDADDAHI
jgi:hypothetical protein